MSKILQIVNVEVKLTAEILCKCEKCLLVFHSNDTVECPYCHSVYMSRQGTNPQGGYIIRVECIKNKYTSFLKSKGDQMTKPKNKRGKKPCQWKQTDKVLGGLFWECGLPRTAICDYQAPRDSQQVNVPRKETPNDKPN